MDNSRYTSLVKKASQLRLSAFSIAEGMRTGGFRSFLRGQGVEFTGVRDYLYGDDIRNIDWNVTARIGKPYIKLHQEDRDFIVFLIVDQSLSMDTGFAAKSRLETANETAALMAFAAEQNSSPVGAVFFDGEVRFSSPPKTGRNQIMLLLSHLDAYSRNRKTGSLLTNSLQGAYQLLKNRSLVIVISDFRVGGYEKALARLATAHDVIAICITDTSDFELPKAGFLSFTDPETKATQALATSSQGFQKDWNEYGEKRLERWNSLCLKRSVTPLQISTRDDPAAVLSKFFSQKEKNQ